MPWEGGGGRGIELIRCSGCRSASDYHHATVTTDVAPSDGVAADVPFAGVIVFVSLSVVVVAVALSFSLREPSSSSRCRSRLLMMSIYTIRFPCLVLSVLP